jgi:hypothetical protein
LVVAGEITKDWNVRAAKEFPAQINSAMAYKKQTGARTPGGRCFL